MPNNFTTNDITAVLYGWVASRDVNCCCISFDIVSVIMSLRVAMSARSHAPCNSTKFCLAAASKPTTSNPAGIVHVVVVSDDPIIEPPWGRPGWSTTGLVSGP